MKRRAFFRRLAGASLAFVCAPGVFRALPAAKNVRAEMVRPTIESQRQFVNAFFFPKPIDAEKMLTYWSELPPIETYNGPVFQHSLDRYKITDVKWVRNFLEKTS